MTENAVKRIRVLTSGGDSPGMNAAVRSIIRTSITQSSGPSVEIRTSMVEFIAFECCYSFLELRYFTTSKSKKYN